jgi:hypothetical protein
MAPCVVTEKCHQSGCETGRGRSRGDGGKIEWKSSEVNTRNNNNFVLNTSSAKVSLSFNEFFNIENINF